MKTFTTQIIIGGKARCKFTRADHDLASHRRFLRRLYAKCGTIAGIKVYFLTRERKLPTSLQPDDLSGDKFP